MKVLWSLKKSSPRPWGCFLLRAEVEMKEQVFPTPVGVFLIKKGLNRANKRLPHARGGVSYEFEDDGCPF